MGAAPLWGLRRPSPTLPRPGGLQVLRTAGAAGKGVRAEDVFKALKTLEKKRLKARTPAAAAPASAWPLGQGSPAARTQVLLETRGTGLSDWRKSRFLAPGCDSGNACSRREGACWPDASASCGPSVQGGEDWHHGLSGERSPGRRWRLVYTVGGPLFHSHPSPGFTYTRISRTRRRSCRFQIGLAWDRQSLLTKHACPGALVSGPAAQARTSCRET